ncbi:hypothetical protein BFP72_06090 [Reichenbachiella sp. 5M10]|uniref:PepSY-associated TM helix domain-containing protein n=1 Tax=Reichenbachiella sp. 5M10 TaxID=1889772 RepID=UPI000C1452B3|nr:PepSY-associated TM helix domain-containing protein [Reichenbachiella sp. 5M10]PIB34992.1 hypothetical protein BFP72_06090 [Reichenbachiella sp. 5M10]
MKKPLKKLILQLHLWIGLLTGLVVFIEGITGAIYVFSGEITEWVDADKHRIPGEPGVAYMPASELQALAQEAIEEKDASLLRFFITNDPKSSIAFTFRKLNPDALFYHDYMETYKTVYLDPYTGKVLKVENTKWEFFNMIMWLHMTLLLNYSLGGTIVAWGVLGFVLLIVSGLILWWPNNKTVRKKRLTFLWKPEFGWKRKNFDLHAVLGFYIIALALIISISGLFYSFHFVSDSLRWIANGGQTIKRPFPTTAEVIPSSDMQPIDIAFQASLLKTPNADSYVVKLPRKPEFPYVVRAYMSKDVYYHRVVHYYDGQTGGLLQTDTRADLTNGEHYSNMNYDIHVGSIGGLPTKILAFLACLIIASLPVTGFLIWRNKSYKI